ncbi:hypothetical protein AVEN_193344-1 [Araneus ventricosus]|uniref:Uncharacterized protein n=1 Tax=Araneus ventricosus TaxID=182803 RepID=A0A4Y2EPI7_ARAVE|nr:hypothetical protein AVEN_193344-1 [Araneus ventricosus]
MSSAQTARSFSGEVFGAAFPDCGKMHPEGGAGGANGNEAPPSEEVLWTAETAAQCICHLEYLQRTLSLRKDLNSCLTGGRFCLSVAYALTDWASF